MKLLILALIAVTVWAQNNCPGFPGCRYTPASEVEFSGQSVTVTYTDITGLERDFEAYVRIPAIRTGPLPVMIWAHGGGDGRVDGNATILSVPSELTATAGYLTISPAFRPRTATEQKALCDYVEAPTEKLCEFLNSPSWDRPYDIQAVIRVLRRENQRQGSPLFGRVDLGRIAVGGHSAGSSATICVAGCSREILGQRYGGPDFFEDPTPIAFIALSPSAPGYSYLFDSKFLDASTTWDRVTRPMLMISGSGDANEQVPHGRWLAYEHMPEADGTHYRFWFDDVDFGHGNYAEDPCELTGAAGQRKCSAFSAAWSSAILSYLDGYVLKRPQALEYLNNGYLTRIPGPLFEIEMSRK